ncbi:MAG TPA: phage antirepressor N-terminal domain-containing protein [Ktedonobacteraceae bacterium]|nr:phage antirepressor N-terminal domain-containing protein [Ktedonobacteraceae bacterium]
MSDEQMALIATQATYSVDFYGEELLIATVENVPYVALRAVCRHLGLAWSSQLQRTKRDPALTEHLRTLVLADSDGRHREMTCLELEYLPGWLLGITPGKARPELEAKLQRYRQECFRILWRTRHMQPCEPPAPIIATPTPLFESLPEQLLPAPTKDKQPRKKHAPPADLVTRDPPSVHVRSDQLAQEIMRGLLSQHEYVQHPELGIAEYQRFFARNKGQILITITAGSDENWDMVLRSLNVLGDEIVDTFIAALALAIDSNGARQISAPFYLSPDDILATCQRARSNGSYTPIQRSTVTEHLRTLSRTHVRASFPLRRGREAFAESPILEVLGGRIGVMNTLTGEEIWEKRQVKIGDWAAMIPEISQQTAIMLRQVLKYHSHNQRYEKRLGRYLTLMFRINAARKGGTFQCSMGVLLEQAGITVNLNKPGETHKMIDKALKRLQEDGVIGKYGQIEDASSKGQEVKIRIEQQAYHWWDLYIQQQWCFWPPETLREVYARLLKEGS